MTDTPDLSLVVPCYNEFPHLKGSAARLIDVLTQSQIDYEILFVDDCSTDDTRQVIKELCDDNPRCRYKFHKTNKGRGGAFKTGFQNTGGKVTGFIDIDLEVDAQFVPELFDQIKDGQYDVVTGHRHYSLRQTRALFRHVLSLGYRVICRLLLKLQVKDSETGCKFFYRKTTEDVVLKSRNNGWFWDTEVMSRASLNNLRILEVPVRFVRNFNKKSTVRPIPDIVRYLKSIYRFRRTVGLTYMDRSPIYWTATGYDLAMKLLFRKQYTEVYEEVAKRIPDDSSIIDVCGGTAAIFRMFFKRKGCDYLLCDGNGHFVMAARRRGIQSMLCNPARDEIPKSDYVILCSSLCHFHKRRDELLARLRRSARNAVIVSESIDNLSTNRQIGPMAKLAGLLTAPGRMTGVDRTDYRFRFDRDSFRKFAEDNDASEIFIEDGKRNGIAVFSNNDYIPATPSGSIPSVGNPQTNDRKGSSPS